jgi:putative IMPACT (imprinted ancient) family translation regulator
VVTRYFGGILLGGGGLVRAYGRAARDAVEKAGVCMYKRKSRMRFACDYDMSGKLLRELEKLGIEPIEKLYEEKVKLAFLCELDEGDKVSSAIADASQGRCRVEFDEYVYAK